jgi:hypothetical protein
MKPGADDCIPAFISVEMPGVVFMKGMLLCEFFDLVAPNDIKEIVNMFESGKWLREDLV